MSIYNGPGINNVKQQPSFEFFIFFAIIFCGGLLFGWWLHQYANTTQEHTSSDAHTTEMNTSHLPNNIDNFPPQEKQDQVDDTKLFQQLLDENRFDDALTLYQEFEGRGSELLVELRQTLINTLAQWQNSGHFDVCIHALERFNQYYYQDIELLKLQLTVLESSNNIVPAIEACISASSHTSTTADYTYFLTSAQRLARYLFKQHQKYGTIESHILLFLKLAYFDPEHAFYRYALADLYLAMGDRENAIRELEPLQLDHEFGRTASERLASLLPVMPELPNEKGPKPIPLTVSGKHFIVTVAIGDKNPVPLLIDTGATYTTLPSTLISQLKEKKLAVQVGYVDLRTANGVRSSPLYKLQKFQIGEYILKDLQVVSLDLEPESQSQGLLGMNVLSQFIFQIDQDRPALILTPR